MGLEDFLPTFCKIMKKTGLKKNIVRKTYYEEVIVEPARQLLSALKDSQATPPLRVKTQARKTATSR